MVTQNRCKQDGECPSDTQLNVSASGERFPLLLFAGSVAVVGLIIAILWYFGVHRDLIRLLEWVEQRGAWSAVFFVLIMALVVVLLVPGIFFTAGAGFVFGTVAGTTYVVLGTTLGAATSFLIARYLFGDRARRYLLSHQRLDAFSREAAQHAFTVVLLTRLIPFFPGKLSNYVFGLTEFPFGRYVAASLIGFIPFSLHNVYLGSMAADLASLSAGELQRSPMQWLLYVLGFIVIFAAVWYFNRLARRSLNRYQQLEIRESEIIR